MCAVYGFDFSYVKAQALAEPLVDTVDMEQICTNSVVRGQTAAAPLLPGASLE